MSNLDATDQFPYSVLFHMLFSNHPESTNALMEIYTRTSGAVFTLATSMAKSEANNQQGNPTPSDAVVDVYTNLWVNNQLIGTWPADSEPEWLATFYSYAHTHLVKLYNSEGDAEDTPTVVSAYSMEREPVKYVPVPIEMTNIVESLPQTARDVFNLAYLQGLNYYQIASKLGSSVETVKSRLRIMMIRLMNEQPEAVHDPLMVQQHYFARDDSQRKASGQFGASLDEDLAQGLLLPWAELLSSGALNTAEREALHATVETSDADLKDEFMNRYRQGIVALSQVAQKVRTEVPVELRERIATEISELEPVKPASPATHTPTDASEEPKKSPVGLVVGIILALIVIGLVLMAIL